MSGLHLDISSEFLEQLVELVTARVLERLDLDRPAHSPLLTILEAADFLRCRRQRVDDHLSAGKLRRYKDGSRTLINRAELEAYVQIGKR